MIWVLAVVAVVAIVSVNALVLGRRRPPRALPRRRDLPGTSEVIERIWTEVASARGLERREGTTLAFAGEIDRVALELELVEERGHLSTLVRAKRATEAPHRLALAPAEGPHAAPSALREAPTATADTVFDRAFVLRIEPDALAVELFGPTARASLVAMLGRAPRLSFDGVSVELVLEGAELVQEHITAALELVLAIAARGG